MGTPGEESSGRIRIHNLYKWLLDPRWGRFTVYIDGRKAGRVDLDDFLDVTVAAEQEHFVRARMWYFLSPRIRVGVGKGETKHLYANVRRNLRPLEYVLMTFKPFVAVYLGDRPNQ